jgi:catechol 2,3-dioxygenase-like lactoylglutathione lyase family enzyme
MISRRLLALSALLAVSQLPVAAQAAPSRPPIVGVAHIGLYTSNLDAAVKFFGDGLGFQQPFRVNNDDGSLMLTYFKVNDHQYIEVFPGLKPGADRLSHIAFETTDIRRLRDYLASRGVKVPAELKPGKDGNLSMMLTDPDGHHVEFVQYMPGSLHTTHFGRDLPPLAKLGSSSAPGPQSGRRISCHILHVGVTVSDRAAADRFYRDILGFREIWHGGMTDNRTEWVDMQVPDGSDWLEYMVGHPHPSLRSLGVMHHLALLESNVKSATAIVAARGVKTQPPQIGRDGKWQENLYDPDGTRVEMMEPRPVEKPCCAPITGRPVKLCRR